MRMSLRKCCPYSLDSKMYTHRPDLSLVWTLGPNKPNPQTEGELPQVTCLLW